MLDQFAPAVETIVRIVELLGVAIIALGAFSTLSIFLVRLARREDSKAAVAHFHRGLGRAILLGLEFLVAADIINTITIELTMESVALLAAIVAIRTFLSFSLEVEIEGRWPWQRASGKSGG